MRYRLPTLRRHFLPTPAFHNGPVVRLGEISISARHLLKE